MDEREYRGDQPLDPSLPCKCSPGTHRPSSVGSSFFPLGTPGRNYQVFAVRTTGKIEVDFKNLKKCPVVAEEEMLREFFHKLNAITGVQIPEDRIHCLPGIPFKALVDEANYRLFIDAVEWVYQKLRQQ